jgi:sigma-B regulation protein RsbU (phosphoserine phosphatase)
VLLRRRLLLLFVALLVSVVVLGAVARVVVRARDDAASRGRTVRVAVELASQLQTAYSDEETGERGFVLTQNPVFLRPYNQGVSAAKRAITALRASGDGLAAVETELRRVERAANDWRTQAAEPEIASVRAGDVDAALASIDAGRGKALFDDLRSAVDTLDHHVNGLVSEADDRSASTRRQLTYLVVAVIAVGLAGTLLAAWFIRRWVTRPIDGLVADIRAVRAGDEVTTIRATGPPEIAELGRNVQEMRAAIDEQRLTAERAREAVEQNAGVVLALRSQLQPDLADLPEGWTVAAELRAAEGVVAGDCYDMVRLADGRVGLIVVDIAGHGPTEGILALRCKELLRASIAAGAGPGRAVEATAEQLGTMGPEVFLTTFVALVDTTNGHVRYANAGHPPAFLCSPDRNVELEPTGPLVGLLGTGWTTRDAMMTPGDSLCIYTDGLIEVRDAGGVFFGPERLQTLVRAGRCEDAASIVRRCLDEAQRFAEGRMHDDATVVVLCRPQDDADSTALGGPGGA